MVRKEFLQSLAVLAAGTALDPFRSLSSPIVGNNTIRPEFVIRVLLNQNMEKLHKNYKASNEGSMPNSTSLVEEAVRIAATTGYSESKGLSDFQTYSVIPKKHTKALNGMGLHGTDKHFKDLPGLASSMLHSHVLTGRNPEVIDWNYFADPHQKQIFESDDYVYVKSLTKYNPKGEIWRVPLVLDYLLYNSSYFCKGLPTQDPQFNDVPAWLENEIYHSNKKYRTLDKKSYMSQDFLYTYAAFDSPNLSPVKTTIYWDYDPAVREYFKWVPVEPCGDPALIQGCTINPGVTRSSVR